MGGEPDYLPVELRCPNGRLHGIIKDHNGLRCFEEKCTHPTCTKGKTVIAFHYYSLKTGELVDTVHLQDHPGRKFTDASA